MITSAENKKIKNVIHLLEKSKARKEQDAFVSEGIKMFEEAPLSDILEVYVSEDYKGPDEKLKQVKYEVVEAGVFKKMADTLTPQGILCVLKKKHYDLDFLLQREDNGLYLVLETVQDPGNLGTIMRTAEGAGVTGVIMSSDTVDIYNPQPVTSTMASIFRVPFIYTDDLDKTIRALKTSGVTCYAAHLKGTKTCYEEDYGKPTAFFIGNEGNGLSEETADLADSYIKIPMGGKLESRNAAGSAAILMYEANRLRF